MKYVKSMNKKRVIEITAKGLVTSGRELDCGGKLELLRCSQEETY
jgi:hypothetical protein